MATSMEKMKKQKEFYERNATRFDEDIVHSLAFEGEDNEQDETSKQSTRHRTDLLSFLGWYFKVERA